MLKFITLVHTSDNQKIKYTYILKIEFLKEINNIWQAFCVHCFLKRVIKILSDLSSLKLVIF